MITLMERLSRQQDLKQICIMKNFIKKDLVMEKKIKSNFFKIILEFQELIL